MGDDSKRPFKYIPKRMPYKGYSEDGKIFFAYGDAAQEGIPYTYTKAGFTHTSINCWNSPLAAEKKYYNPK